MTRDDSGIQVKHYDSMFSTQVFSCNVVIYDTREKPVYKYWCRACYISENKLENICLEFSRFFGVCFFIFLQKMFTLSRQNWLCLACVDCCP